ncbi:uncharacterized protein J8A68_004862 [[Candida] subhashii]|uniref:Uncharacterized protein n=1 Tax=[Candida] subhashii TaxID=561895 RepID=A0A8J5UWG8_9ASCO|nr:uncharacterized protein J8A68_004862 [[Candida] subhashii]KAG7661594.1 hypothetical protein J8A68_004862 [[Candida] subhashii]
MKKAKKSIATQNKIRKVLHHKLITASTINADSNRQYPQRLTPSILKNDNCDLLIYLIYMKYINDLIKGGGDPKYGLIGKNGEITEQRLNNANDELIRKYQG